MMYEVRKPPFDMFWCAEDYQKRLLPTFVRIKTFISDIPCLCTKVPKIDISDHYPTVVVYKDTFGRKHTHITIQK